MADVINIEKTKLFEVLNRFKNKNIVKMDLELIFDTIKNFTNTCLSEGKLISDIQSVILTALQIDVVKQNRHLDFNIIYSFTRACLDKNIPIQDSTNSENNIQSVILAALQIDVVKQKPNLVGVIIDGFTQACLGKGQEIKCILEVILEILKTDIVKQNLDLVSTIIRDFTQNCLFYKKQISYILPVILAALQIEAVKENPDLAFKIIKGFTQGCLLQKQTIKSIQSVILATLQIDAVKQNPDLASMIIFGFTQACLRENKPIKDETNPENDIQSVISEAIKQYPNLAGAIIDGFTQGCLSFRCDIGYISKIISEIMKSKQTLVSDIINGFATGYLRQMEVIAHIQPLIPDALKQAPNLFSDTISNITQTYLPPNKPVSEISEKTIELITKDIQKESNRLVFEIIKNYFPPTKLISKIFPVILEIVKYKACRFHSNCEFIYNFITVCLNNSIPIQDSKNPEEDIQSAILKLSKVSRISFVDIIYGFTKACLDKDIPIQDSKHSGNDIQSVIQEIFSRHVNIVEDILASIYGFTKACLEKGIPIQDSTNPGNDILSIILNIFTNKRVFSYDIIIKGFIKACLDKGIPIQDSKHSGNDIQSIILNIILNIFKKPEIQNLCDSVIKGFIEACLDKDIPIQNSENSGNDIQSVILAVVQNKVMQQNSNFIVEIMKKFTSSCLSYNKQIKDIWPALAAVLQTEFVQQNPCLADKIMHDWIGRFSNPYSKNNINNIVEIIPIEVTQQNPKLVRVIAENFIWAVLPCGPNDCKQNEIIILSAIQRNPNLAFAIINALSRSYFTKGKIQDLISIFQNLLKKIQKPEFSIENKTLLINQIKSCSILILSKYLKDTLFTLENRTSLLKKGMDEKIESELLNLFQTLYPTVFQYAKEFKDIKLKDLIPIWQIYFASKIKIRTIDGGELYEFLPFLFDIFKDKDLTIGQFIEQTKILSQNFYRIDLDSEEGKDQLKKIKKESENKDKPFIVYTTVPEHVVVLIIKKGQISIIDSSQIIFYQKYSESKEVQNILIKCGFEIDDKEKMYFNEIEYQENGTCYLDAALAFKCIMEKLYLQQKGKKPEDAPTTLNSVLSDLKKETSIPLKSIPLEIIPSECPDLTKNIQQIIVDMVSEAAKFYQILQKPVDSKYLISSDTSRIGELGTSTERKEEEFMFPCATKAPSSEISEEAANDRAKENLQEKLKLGEITKEILAIKPLIIATIIANTSIASKLVTEFATIPTIFGAIPEVQKEKQAIQKAQQEVASKTYRWCTLL